LIESTATILASKIGDASSDDLSGELTLYPVDTSAALADLLKEYEIDKKPIDVSFRELVDWVKVGERATHYLHSYPAKLLPQIAHFFLATETLVGSSEIVLDPFGGTGTVALETVLSGRNAYYADANPLARLIAETKTTPLSDSSISEMRERIVAKFQKSRASSPPDVVNLTKWFDDAVVRKLARLRSAIVDVDDPCLRAFMLVTFSAVIRKVSKADKRFSVPVRMKDGQADIPADVLAVFEKQLAANRTRMAALVESQITARAKSVGVDARSLKDPDNGNSLASQSVGLILTSPPYAGAQKYIRASSLNLGWLELAPSSKLRELEERTIGREHFSKSRTVKQKVSGIPEADTLIRKIAKVNPLRATIAATYLVEMRQAFVEMVRVLKPNAHIVLVIGDNTICGHRFASSTYLKLMLEGLGLTTILELRDPIKSRGLLTKRALSAPIISHETIIVFKKESLRS
jgi:DNA modification methylase